MYYLTNYAAKDDIKPHQMILKAALVKEAIEKAKATSEPSPQQLRLWDAGEDQFLLRSFNSLSNDREISGVQIASSLLQLPPYYTHSDRCVEINIWWLRRYPRLAIESVNALFDSLSESTSEEQCSFQAKDTAPVSRFDYYKWRGSSLAGLCFFEYCMLVQIEARKELRMMRNLKLNTRGVPHMSNDWCSENPR